MPIQTTNSPSSDSDRPPPLFTTPCIDYPLYWLPPVSTTPCIDYPLYRLPHALTTPYIDYHIHWLPPVSTTPCLVQVWTRLSLAERPAMSIHTTDSPTSDSDWPPLSAAGTGPVVTCGACGQSRAHRAQGFCRALLGHANGRVGALCWSVWVVCILYCVVRLLDCQKYRINTVHICIYGSSQP